MKIHLDCIPCFVKQAVDAPRLLRPDGEDVAKTLLAETLEWVRNIDPTETPPLMGARIHARLKKLIGEEDPYASIKKRMNERALQMKDRVREEIARSADPIEYAVKAAVAANSIDLGVDGGATEEELWDRFHHSLQSPLRGDGLEPLKEILPTAWKILYITDNAGEIVFDGLLMEAIGPEKITVAVRGGPIINDATMYDAESVGITGTAKEVIDTGEEIPGVTMEGCSEQFRRYYEEADLIVAKGQGNFESLSEYPRKNVFFLLKAKCAVVSKYADQPIGSLLVLTGHEGGFR